MRRQTLLLALVAVLAAGASGAEVLVEAESFAKRGGWVVDQQFMDQMGSPYLLAHGLGEPVADATTTVTFRSPGTYRVFVRTMDWVARWKAPGAPGRFQLAVGGATLRTTFGTQGAGWHWQYGGTVTVAGKKATLTLHDLTGFEGRCDAVWFTTDTKLTPPNDLKTMAGWRKKLLGLPADPPDAGRFDLVVVGGGVAGTCAAVSAAREGLQVALIQNRPVLGGNNSSEVRVCQEGKANLPPFPNVGNILHELCPPRSSNNSAAFLYGDSRKERLVRAEKNIRLFLNTHAFKVHKRGRRITAVIAKNTRTSRELRFAAPLFVDCTGDGTIGYLAGADYRMGREGRSETGETMAPAKPDRRTMGSSNLWNSTRTAGPSRFPDCEWAVRITDRNCPKAYRGRPTHGSWWWESGMGYDTIADAEYIRDYNFRVVYGVWSFVKNRCAEKAQYANRKLKWLAYVAGKRESRRLLGDVILSQQDIEQAKPYPDGCVTTTWPIDLHFPKRSHSKHFPGEEFLAGATSRKIKPYPIPYRCFYSRNVENLMMAGRNISVTHVALGSVRVMITTGAMGEAVGKAAAICAKRRVAPRDVYTKHLTEYKRLLATSYRHIYVPFSDRTRVRMTGAWKKRFTRDGYGYAGDYNERKGAKSIRFVPHVPQAGRYEVLLRWFPKRGAAKAVPVTVRHAAGEKTVSVDLTTGGGSWVSIGSYAFKAGTAGGVLVTNKGTTGFVVIEAVLLRPAAR